MLVVVRRVGELQRQDAEVDQVLAVDAGEGLRDHRLDAQIHRRKRGVLARGALAVVLAAEDEPAAELLARARELGVDCR